MVFLYGPPAVGKLTVAKELSNLTGFRFFINHQASDPVRSILDFENDPTTFRRISNDVKNLILEKAVDMNLPGLIMTFCYSRPDSDYNLRDTMGLLKRKGGVETYFSQLDCIDEELFKRVQDPSRKMYSVKKLSNVKELKEAMSKFGFREKIPYVQSLYVDTTNMSPRETAEAIAKYHHFPPYSNSP